eukprot:1723113-Amphidinium_carterae.2
MSEAVEVVLLHKGGLTCRHHEYWQSLTRKTRQLVYGDIKQLVRCHLSAQAVHELPTGQLMI